MKFKNFFCASMVSAAMIVPQIVLANSDLQTGPTGTTAQADLSFRVIIEDFVFIQVGSLGLNVETLEWNLTGQQIGLNAALPPTGGDFGVSGDVPVIVHSNAAAVDLTVNPFTLDNGAGDSIPMDDILVTNAATITPPTVPGAPGAQTVNTSSFLPIHDTWTYTYADDTVFPAGTYFGTATYTATSL